MNGFVKGVVEGDPTKPAKMHYIDDNEIQMPAEKAPLSQKNGKELLAVGQKLDRTRLDQENESKSMSETVSHENGNETLELDRPDGSMKSTKRGRSGFPKEPQLNCLGGDDNEFLPLKRLKNGNIDCEILHNMSWNDENDKTTLPSNRVVSQRNDFDNAEDNNEIAVLHPNESKKNVSNETEDRHKGHDERERSSNDGHSGRTLSLNVNDIMSIAEEKRIFLNSRSTYGHDSQATSGKKALRICCKCRKGGQLLICSVNSCQIMGHESCLGPQSGFDDEGNFYCPFCSCERKIIPYLDAKEEVALTMKHLTAFIGADKSYQQKSKSRSPSQEPQSKNPTDVEMPERNHDHGEQTVVEHQKEAEDVGRLLNGCCTQAETSTGSERNVIVLIGEDPSLVDNQQTIGENPSLVDNQQTKGVKKDQQSTEPLNSCCNDDLSLRKEKTVASTGTPSVLVAMERGNANMPKEAQPFGKEEEKKKQEFACMEEISYPGTVSVGHKPTKHRNLNPLLQEQTVKPLPEPSSQPNVTANKNVENINIFRRKKVPWTVEEEEILVEGVRKFSSTDCKDVPWKIILEFGQHVFQKNRKPVDLKDKWRNICKRGGPKSQVQVN